MQPKSNSIFNVTVIVAALGYFVDIYDLLLFSIIRVESLTSLGLTPEQLTTDGESIISWQMGGLLIGGILWGMLGDKKGRLSVLFGSIILYSLANIANGLVTTVDQYAMVRFIAGVGLAGELGAGITLVSEMTPKEKRGIATSMVAGIGLTGAVVAFIVKENFHWRTCYFIGGGLGLALLLLRISVFESGMFNEVKKMNVKRGSFFMLFTNGDRLKRYILAILIGLPTWFVIGVLVTFSKEFAEHFGIKEKVDSGKAIMFAYAAISAGDIIIGFVSQWFRSRKKALFLFYGITIFFMVLYFTVLWNSTASAMYWVCAGLGFGTGFWAIFVTMGAEQFGTNLRATAATTIPNMVRGLLAIAIIPLFKWLRGIEGLGYVQGGMYAAIILMAVTLIAAAMTKETFGKDLNFVEE
ncbi:MFS transporter [Pseudobacter ginsenosidimutans]|uniref:MFS transporter n=1 Tax=Pseudobacter ginsenosidimutans TaxID=661488 RepID=A0A4Q7MD09_9BACT|nr:MFS transporter [Pseudobacter ginsenosidimutans]QEC42627.1 MFS transporter [Pseudobacter ginsenosidimutans]RZS65223.1 MFS transporter [Pseudobacter ginsenosidimutans]